MRTIGLAIISTSSGVPVVSEQALLLPRPGDSGLELTKLPNGLVGKLLCQASERAIGSKVADALGDATSLLAVAHQDFLVGRGALVGRIRLEGHDLEIAGWTLAPSPVEEIRYDSVGGRAYADLRQGQRTFDLRNGGITSRPGVGVSTWIDRRDQGSLSVALSSGTVRLARVRR